MATLILCVIFAVTTIILTVKLLLMKKGLKEISDGISENLLSETNQLIYVSSGDRHIKQFASEISHHIIEFRKQRQLYVSGDRELKSAVANISHDLRTPLTAICGYLDLLKSEEKSEKAERYIEQISNRTEALIDLTEELFKYSVISSETKLVFEEINIISVLEESLISFYGSFSKKNIVPKICIPQTSIICSVDKLALSRVFGNIINNALKYSDGDFVVSVYEPGRIVFSNSASDLSTVEVARLFDRFYTVDSAHKSTGLGLSIAKILTERMNGEISAEYKNGVLSIIVTFE